MNSNLRKKKVFISSVFHNFMEYREAVVQAIKETDEFEAVHSESLENNYSEQQYSKNARETILEKLVTCDFYVCILGTRYGSPIINASDGKKKEALILANEIFVHICEKTISNFAQKIHDDTLEYRITKFEDKIIELLTRAYLYLISEIFSATQDELRHARENKLECFVFLKKDEKLYAYNFESVRKGKMTQMNFYFNFNELCQIDSLELDRTEFDRFRRGTVRIKNMVIS